MRPENTQIKDDLRESEKRFKQLFENISSGVAVYEATENGENFIFKDFNKTAEKIERITKDELIGRSVTDVFPNVAELGLLEVFKKVWQTGEPEHHPIAFYKDERIEGWRKNYIYKSPSGDIVALFDDVTKHQDVVEKLRESESRYRSIVGVIPDLIIKTNREGVYLDIISQADESLYISKEELLGSRITDVLPMETATIITACLRKSIDENTFQIVEYELEVPAGKNYFEARILPLSENFAYALIRDISNRRRMEKEKEKLIKDLKDALAEVKTLKGLLPICSHCKKIRDDKGYWNQIETFVEHHSEAEFSHGMCPDCSDKLYGNQEWYIEMKTKKGR